MKVLYDHQTFGLQEYGGVSRYFYELIKRGKEDQALEVGLSIKLSNNAYLKLDKKNKVSTFFPEYKFKGKERIMNFINKANSIIEIGKKQQDIFHPTYYDPYFIERLKGKPYVITFHDMIHEKFSDKYASLAVEKNLLERKQLLADNAAKVIAISESTKSDMIEILGIHPDKIEVIYHASSINALSAANQSIFPFPYLLYVGNRIDYKNFNFFLHSVSSLLHKGEVKLVCAGGGKLNQEEVQLIRKLNIKNEVFQISFDDGMLATLYKHAEAFVFPSLYEGFGIPILEAFSCGCPCLISNVSSMPEVAGNAAVYFDPTDSLSIENAVSSILHDKDKLDELRKLGFSRYKNFSWDKTYKETVRIYHSVHNN